MQTHILTIINFLLLTRTKLYTSILFSLVISVLLGVNNPVY